MYASQVISPIPQASNLGSIASRLWELTNDLWVRIQSAVLAACPVTTVPNGYQSMLDGLIDAADADLEMAHALYVSESESDRDHARDRYHAGVFKLRQACILYETFRRLGYQVYLRTKPDATINNSIK